jgi:hypothetical protein
MHNAWLLVLQCKDLAVNDSGVLGPETLGQNGLGTAKMLQR